MKSRIITAVILALGISLAGYFVFLGISKFSNNARIVQVKGLAEMEVKSNKVVWPLMFKEVGNDLGRIYTSLNAKTDAITAFLKDRGISESEITYNAPEIIDMQAERYISTPAPYRYNVTSVMTVTSTNVDLVMKLIREQSELLKQGIAITSGDYRYNVTYEYTGLNSIKPKMIEEATKNARAAAEKFAKDSDSKVGKIKSASQGLFSIENRDENTPYIKKVRVVTSLDYLLED